MHEGDVNPMGSRKVGLVSAEKTADPAVSDRGQFPL